MNIIVYTAITGNKDKPRKDILCFGAYDKFSSPVMNSKIYKVLPHKYIEYADISVYLDGNIKLNIPVERLVKEFLGEADMALHKHPDRDDVYDECDATIKWKPEEAEDVRRYKAYLEIIRFPRHNGLYNGGVIIRRHNKKVEAFNNAWWAEICTHSSRDQISLAVVLSRFPDLKVRVNDGSPSPHPRRKHHPYYTYVKHFA